MAGKLILDLKEQRDCRYPLWEHAGKFDPATDRFCGNPIERGSPLSFCSDHLAIVRKTPQNPSR